MAALGLILAAVVAFGAPVLLLMRILAMRRAYRNGWDDCGERLATSGVEYCRAVAENRRYRSCIRDTYYKLGWFERLELNNEENND